tara:strand:+ start:459 stop:599 length:141 start_codon:yes stop_codon:yes gene_type:complete
MDERKNFCPNRHFYVVIVNGFLSAQFSRFGEKREKKAKKTKIIPRF